MLLFLTQSTILGIFMLIEISIKWIRIKNVLPLMLSEYVPMGQILVLNFNIVQGGYKC